MYCRQCGLEHTSLPKFCSSCGAKLGGPSNKGSTEKDSPNKLQSMHPAEIARDTLEQAKRLASPKKLNEAASISQTDGRTEADPSPPRHGWFFTLLAESSLLDINDLKMLWKILTETASPADKRIQRKWFTALLMRPYSLQIKALKMLWRMLKRTASPADRRIVLGVFLAFFCVMLTFVLNPVSTKHSATKDGDFQVLTENDGAKPVEPPECHTFLMHAGLVQGEVYGPYARMLARLKQGGPKIASTQDSAEYRESGGTIVFHPAEDNYEWFYDQRTGEIVRKDRWAYDEEIGRFKPVKKSKKETTVDVGCHSIEPSAWAYWREETGLNIIGAKHACWLSWPARPGNPSLGVALGQNLNIMAARQTLDDDIPSKACSLPRR